MFNSSTVSIKVEVCRMKQQLKERLLMN